MADREYYRRLSPAERIHILLELIERHHEGDDEASKGFARVYRITNLNESWYVCVAQASCLCWGSAVASSGKLMPSSALLVQDKADLDSLGEL